LILDTSVQIDADRTGRSVAEMLERLATAREEPIAVSSITLMEFASGIALASSDQRRERRRRFADDLRSQMPVLSFGSELAIRTGAINGELRSRGVTVGALDLMIGVTALMIGYSMGTKNLRDFQRIPELDVVEL
jgi:tRNA(fMet)-specific endonuclease VapC